MEQKPQTKFQQFLCYELMIAAVIMQTHDLHIVTLILLHLSVHFQQGVNQLVLLAKKMAF